MRPFLTVQGGVLYMHLICEHHCALPSAFLFSQWESPLQLCCHFLTCLHGFGCESVGKTFALPRSFPDQAKALGVDEEVTKVFSGLLNWMQCITSKDG